MDTPLIQIRDLHLHLNTVLPIPLPPAKSGQSGNSSKDRFELSESGDIVTDHKIGLMWPVYESREQMDCEGLAKYVESFRLGGFDGWFIPSLEQRESIRDMTRWNPALFEPLKSRSGGWEWTSTPYAPAGKTDAGVPAAFWQVRGYDGHVHGGSRSNKAFARPCRVVARASQ